MSERRPPAVAGHFYPGDAEALRALVADCLDGVPADRHAARAAIVPHAGLMYSGKCAGAVLGRLAFPPTVVIVAPNHHARGHAPAALWASGAFETPLGPCPVDEAFARDFLQRCALAAHDAAAHRLEHAVEVELPFLRRLSPASRIVPVLLAFDRWDWVEQVAAALAATILASAAPALLLASSDMTHYEPAEVAIAKDRLAIASLARLDGRALLEVCEREQITMCGRAAAAVVIEAARRLGATRAELLDHRHSGLVTGDATSVVSYAGLIID